MKKISVFDIIGPIMIGPSSSHTAGALRISLIAYKIFKGTIKEVKFTLYGSFAKTYKGHGTDRALLGGIMGFDTDDDRIRNSFDIADNNNLKYSFVEGETTPEMHPNTVRIDILGEDSSMSLVGESIGGGSVLVRQINGIDVKFTGEYTTIMVQQIDKPGVVAHITKVLSENNINIAVMSLFRESLGEKAFTMLELDEKVSEDILLKLKENEYIIDTFLISI